MKILLGLGNPGPTYTNTRHNAGSLLVDYLSTKLKSDYGWRKHFGAEIYKTDNWLLVKSKDVFMNESGRLLQGLNLIPTLLLNSGEGNLYVAHDDLDIRLGEYKIQKGKGPKDHGGVNSVEETLKTKDFWRVRIGIDNREPHFAEASRGEEYVLGKFSLEERKILEGVLERIVHEVAEANN